MRRARTVAHRVLGPCRDLLVVASLALLLPAATAAAQQRLTTAFPHARHQRLFPLCEGCHAGISGRGTGALYPQPADCAQCHDGTRQKRVEWVPRGHRPSTLRFSHSAHVAALERTGEALPACQACHAAPGTPERMNVAGPDPARCLQCHAHANPVHLAQTATCNSCHLPLARAVAVPAERIADFPRPPWHESADFASSHGRTPATAATCATCHARESCQRCHANAERVPLIAALERDVRVASLQAGRAPAYPTPPSHAALDWAREHGPGAASQPASCGNCHTRATCAACHRLAEGVMQGVLASLPAPSPAARLGVGASRMARTVHPADIGTRHGRLAASGILQCGTCHATRACTACHAAADSRAFHGANFVEKHAVDVFASTVECQSCHNTERFCRECHVRTGVASQGRMNSAFHTGQAMWVLSHGLAARMGMESCVSCHRQSDCVRCHSASSGWGVNPHGAGYPANALAARNSASCAWCHLSKPGGSR